LLHPPSYEPCLTISGENLNGTTTFGFWWRLPHNTELLCVLVPHQKINLLEYLRDLVARVDELRRNCDLLPSG
jgi:hypothetical protein